MEIIYSDIEIFVNCVFDFLEIYDGRFKIYYIVIVSKCIYIYISILKFRIFKYMIKCLKYYEILYFVGEYELIRK